MEAAGVLIEHRPWALCTELKAGFTPHVIKL
jgi:hypothetical protein